MVLEVLLTIHGLFYRPATDCNTNLTRQMMMVIASYVAVNKRIAGFCGGRCTGLAHGSAHVDKAVKVVPGGFCPWAEALMEETHSASSYISNCGAWYDTFACKSRSMVWSVEETVALSLHSPIFHSPSLITGGAFKYPFSSK